MSTFEVSGLGVSPQVFDEQTFGAAVVSKTLDYMNQNKKQFSSNCSYDFQQSALLPVYTGKGTFVDSMV